MAQQLGGWLLGCCHGHGLQLWLGLATRVLRNPVPLASLAWHAPSDAVDEPHLKVSSPEAPSTMALSR